ncbi:hypothetical protein [Rhodothalassium salexigens]|nr:hypothetical protein [Rhodothalassium salexigens]
MTLKRGRLDVDADGRACLALDLTIAPATAEDAQAIGIRVPLEAAP